MIRRTAIISFIVILVGGTVGYFAAGGANDYLAVTFTEKDLPDPGSVEVHHGSTVQGRSSGSPATEFLPGSIAQERSSASPARESSAGSTAQEGSPGSPAQALPLRIVDMGGVGVLPDTAAWGGDYDHNQHFFEDVMLAEAPFINREAYKRERQKLDDYSERMGRFGYNAIAMPWFLEFINFEKVGNGQAVYRRNSVYRQRHDTLSHYAAELMEVCAGHGLKSYLWTDMVVLTTPLKEYLEKQFGDPDPEDPAFWNVYRLAAEEAFERFPNVEGIIIRIGEAGSIYNMPGWDYYSELYVTTAPAVQNMLKAFLAAAERYGKTIIFRSWSVGIGEIGDMHTSVETYHQILDDIDSDHLVVSTKYCRGDFYSFLELNPTLYAGSHKRIAEFQAKREYEGFGSIPNYVAPLHQLAIQSFMERNPQFGGVWVWTQYGGPLRAGPMIIYPFHGFNAINDAIVYATSRVVTNPNADIRGVTAEWVRMTFGEDPALVRNLTEFLLRSHEAVKKGLYISEFAKYDVRALGLEPPPMLWIFEWDILGASGAVFSNIYYITRAHREEVVSEGFEAVKMVREMKKLLLEVKDSLSMNHALYDQLLASAEYEEHLFTLLAEYRQFFMKYYTWLDTGNEQAKADYGLALSRFKSMKTTHREQYGADLDFPALELFEADQGCRVAGNTTLSIIAARLLLVLIGFLFLAGLPGLRTSRGARRFAASLLFDSAFRPYRVSRLNSYYRPGLILFLSLLLYATGIAVFSSFAAPVFTLSIIILSLVYILIPPFLSGDRMNFRRIPLSLMAPKMLMITLLLIPVAFRGPMFFWYGIWTSDLFRTLFLVIFLAMLFRKFHVHVVTTGKWTDRNISGSAGMVMMALGVQLVAAGLVMQAAGLERSLTVLNDELLVLPGGLSRILGITTHLGIPGALPLWIIYLALILLVSGSLCFIFNRKKKKMFQQFKRA
ncbi:MAG: hypothetical protein JXR52_07315 [Bacteroidales bacterium]|nr:hypothetical protein [Bacteroidales bacterium]